MESLIAEQRAQIATLGRILPNFLKITPADVTLPVAEGRHTLLLESWKRVQNNHFKLTAQAEKDKIDKSHIEYFLRNEFEKSEEAFLEAYDVLNEIRSGLKCSTSLLDITTPNARNSNSFQNANRSFHLPHIELPKFSGNYLEWPNFRDLFENMIDKHADLSKSEKFQHLKASLKDEALNAIRHLGITDANYDSAWNMLKTRYENKRAIITAYLHSFISLPVISNESAKELKILRDTLNEALQALKNVERPVDTWDDLIVYLTASKLNKGTLAEWERYLGDKTECPTYKDIDTFLSIRIRTLESLQLTRELYGKNINKSRSLTSQPHNSTVSQSQSVTCLLCKSNHFLYQCSQFKAQTVERRKEIARENRCCYNCLKPGHLPRQCKSRSICFQCKRRHHTLLHNEQFSSNDSDNSPKGQKPLSKMQNASSENMNKEIQSSSSFNSILQNRENDVTHIDTSISAPVRSVMLATAHVIVKAPDGRSLRIRALLDQGSQSTLVSEWVVQLLRLKRQPTMIELNGPFNVALGVAKSKVEILISPVKDEEMMIPITALVKTRVSSYVLPNQGYSMDWDHLNDLYWADPDPFSKQEIGLIIGADYYGSILLPDLRKGSSDAPVAQATVFGWILSGQLGQNPASRSTSIVQHCTSFSDLQSDLKLFWELEEIPKEPLLTEEEQIAEKHFCDTHYRNEEGRYVVRLPFKPNGPKKLGHSLKIATSMWHRTENRLKRDPDLFSSYTSFLKEYEELNHMVETPFDSQNHSEAPSAIYLPHHPVIRETSSTTRVRVVFNASSRTSSGSTLNDQLLVGPKLQADLIGIILRWRLYRYVMITDIVKMFRQILIDPQDVDYQRIIGKRECDGPLVHFKLLTVTYGTACAPYLANRVIKQLAEDEGSKYPEAKNIILRDFYVDDGLFGADDLNSALRLQSEIIEIFKRGCLPLSKWASNHHSLIPSENKESSRKEIKLSVKTENRAVLGLLWNAEQDSFQFQISFEKSSMTTKRVVLSMIARLYDPVGWLSPVVIVAKTFMQELWLHNLDWDDELPPELKARWDTYCTDLINLQDIRIPRWIGCSSMGMSFELHGFSDASKRAYAAVVYLRVLNDDQSARVVLITSKTKVAPVKTVCIPRLELCGAQILARLILKTKRDLNLETVPIHCWTDATIVLDWISKHPSTWPTFVANRVSDIQTLLPNTKWRHVSTRDNPADLASRGCSPSLLKPSNLWWSGPSWLKKPSVFWPQEKFSMSNPNPYLGTLLEVQSKKLINQVTTKPVDGILTRVLNTVSTWPKLLRSTAYLIRFIDYLGKSKKGSQCLNAQLINRSRTLWIKILQKQHFREEINKLQNHEIIKGSSPLKNLSPFLDKDNVIRVGGRLENAPISWNAKHPIILPSNHVTELIARQAHLRALHAGPQLTLFILRQDFWIIGARNIVKRIINQCVNCIRQKAVMGTQIMGQLPVARVSPSKPFSHTGMDYAGPISVKIWKGRGYKAQKAYLALFVCLATRALHLDLVTDYSTDAFLAAFSRFVSRRGLPTDLYSDNGTNFQGADKELKRHFQSLSDDKELQHFLAQNQIVWHFNPPAAPHFGGIWEAGVKSVKQLLRREFKNYTLTFEELTTVLCKIEACLNSRPVFARSDNYEDWSYLSPGHFLVGGPLTAVPERSVLNINENRLTRWELLHRITETFWKRWSMEYLLELQNKYKWLKYKSNVKIGDLVLLQTPNAPPTMWKLGRIIQCHPGNDNQIRVITVKTAQGIYKRPITQTCILPLESKEEVSKENQV